MLCYMKEAVAIKSKYEKEVREAKLHTQLLIGLCGGIRTPDLLLRRQLLYPTELHTGVFI